MQRHLRINLQLRALGHTVTIKLEEQFKVGDHVRVVNYLMNNKMPVGIIERINGAYHYVHVAVSDETEDDRCVYECYPNELVKVSEAEYFKLVLSGVNLDLQ